MIWMPRMRHLFLLLSALTLSACTIGSQPLAFATASPAPTDPALSLSTLAAASVEPTARPTSAPTQTPPADPFAANFLMIPAPDCTKPTPALEDGPAYMPGAPERTNLHEEGMPGEKLLLAGFVVDQNCLPIPGARMDFWQADANGVMDETGFRLRGRQSTDSQGRYFLETVVPGALQPIHVRVEPPGGAPFITQIFFPLSSAGLPELHMDVDAREGLYVAYFSFVLTR